MIKNTVNIYIFLVLLFGFTVEAFAIDFGSLKRTGFGQKSQFKQPSSVQNYHAPSGTSTKSRAVKAYNTGNAYLRAGDYKTAEAYYRKALRLKSNDYGAHNNLGVALERQKRYFEAMDEFRIASRGNSHGRTNLARMEEWLPRFRSWEANNSGVDSSERGNYEAALTYFKRAIKLDPNNHTARQNLKKIEEYLKQKQERAKAREKVPDILDDLAQSGSNEVGLTFLDTDETLIVKPPSEKQKRQARQKHLKKFTKKSLDIEIKRVNKIMIRMKKDFQRDVRGLNELKKEIKDAEEKALIVSVKLLAGSAIKLEKIKNLDSKTAVWIKSEVEGVLGAMGDLGDTDFIIKYLEKPSDKELKDKVIEKLGDKGIEKLEADLKQRLTKRLMKKPKKELERILENVSHRMALAKFGIDYSYEATRWILARKQLYILNSNLDSPKGKLKAQKAMKEMYEDLIQERKRR
ncbi:tetratricopeptide repeat protein [Candidatus Margulisiibacteriota bacterium]